MAYILKPVKAIDDLTFLSLVADSGGLEKDILILRGVDCSSCDSSVKAFEEVLRRDPDYLILDFEKSPDSVPYNCIPFFDGKLRDLKTQGLYVSSFEGSDIFTREGCTFAKYICDSMFTSVPDAIDSVRRR